MRLLLLITIGLQQYYTIPAVLCSARDEGSSGPHLFVSEYRHSPRSSNIGFLDDEPLFADKRAENSDDIEARRRSTVDKNFMRFGRSQGNKLLASDHDSQSDKLVKIDDDFSQDEREVNGARYGRSGNMMRFGRGDNLMRFGRNDNRMRFGRSGENLMRFGRSGENLMRFGRSGENLMRFGRSGENLMRFGRAGDNLMRFGRAGDNLMRFGRAGDNLMRFGRSKDLMRFGRSENLMRFGRNDNRMRFGRSNQNVMRFGRSKPDSQTEDKETGLEGIFDIDVEDNTDSFHKSDDLSESSHHNTLREFDEENAAGDHESASRVPRSESQKGNTLNGFALSDVDVDRTNLNTDNFMRLGRSLDDHNKQSDSDDKQANQHALQSDEFNRYNDNFLRLGRSTETSADNNDSVSDHEMANNEFSTASRRKRSIFETPVAEKNNEKGVYVSQTPSRMRMRMRMLSPLSSRIPSLILGPELFALPIPPDSARMKRNKNNSNFMRFG